MGFYQAQKIEKLEARIAELEALLSDVNTGYAECIAEREDLKVALVNARNAEKRIWIDALLENLPEEKAVLFRDICVSAEKIRASRAAMEVK